MLITIHWRVQQSCWFRIKISGLPDDEYQLLTNCRTPVPPALVMTIAFMRSPGGFVVGLCPLFHDNGQTKETKCGSLLIN